MASQISCLQIVLWHVWLNIVWNCLWPHSWRMVNLKHGEMCFCFRMHAKKKSNVYRMPFWHEKTSWVILLLMFVGTLWQAPFTTQQWMTSAWTAGITLAESLSKPVKLYPSYNTLIAPIPNLFSKWVSSFHMPLLHTHLHLTTVPRNSDDSIAQLARFYLALQGCQLGHFEEFPLRDQLT